MERRPELEQLQKTIRDYFLGLRPELKQQQDGLATLPLRQFVDSIGMLEFLSFLETEFGINVEGEEMIPEHFESITAAAGYEAKKLS